MTTDEPRSNDVWVTRPQSESRSDRLSVLVVSDRVVMTRLLPDVGEVVIGRSPQADLIIDDPSISRTHAVVSIGPPLTVRDLESANGTHFRDRMLAPGEVVEFVPGDVIEVGNATLVVQRRTPPARAQRIWAHGYFEVRLDEECARARREGGTFAVARLHCDPPLPVDILQEVLMTEARTSDVVGEYGPQEYEILVRDVAPDKAEAALARLVSQVEERSVKVQSGLACFPRDGRDGDELVLRASPLPRQREAGFEASVSAAVVADRRMQNLYRLAERIAAGDIAVLILGETGVGKEALAERLHRLSPRSTGPYLKLNCAALPESLVESELFGHERGPSTGATQSKLGLIETADGGTVFFDEIGELTLALQMKLLRVLEERRVARVGSLTSRQVDVRFVAATNRDLEGEIARGTFRQDLHARLNGATLVIPPLRERTSEIPALTRAFIAQAARQMAFDQQPSVSEQAMAALMGYSWPGNIRELRNVVERAVLLAGPEVILPRHLPLEKMRVTIGVATPAPRVPATAPPPLKPDTPVTSLNFSDSTTMFERLPADEDIAGPGPSDAERERILNALSACAGNQTAAARMLGIARRTLVNRLDLYGITRPRKGR